MMAPKDSEIIVTSHDNKYEFEGCRRHEPVNNVLEIDRFTEELIEDNMCFLYGDTYYTEKAIESILNLDSDDILFFGNNKSIVAIKIFDENKFKLHRDRVRSMFINGEICECKGWQIYQSFTGQDMMKPAQIGKSFIFIGDSTQDINTVEDYIRIM